MRYRQRLKRDIDPPLFQLFALPMIERSKSAPSDSNRDNETDYREKLIPSKSPRLAHLLRLR
jgi:hypothetical protein